jgi:tetratricopeptide (TPR) repeat protein
LRRGIGCAPSEASLYRELGEYLVQKGQINEAQEILEKGLEVNPLHAPLYHSLAELEARIFNVAGLSKLNKCAKTIVTTNALKLSPSSTQA